MKNPRLFDVLVSLVLSAISFAFLLIIPNLGVWSDLRDIFCCVFGFFVFSFMSLIVDIIVYIRSLKSSAPVDENK